VTCVHFFLVVFGSFRKNFQGKKNLVCLVIDGAVGKNKTIRLSVCMSVRPFVS